MQQLSACTTCPEKLSTRCLLIQAPATRLTGQKNTWSQTPLLSKPLQHMQTSATCQPEHDHFREGELRILVDSLSGSSLDLAKNELLASGRVQKKVYIYTYIHIYIYTYIHIYIYTYIHIYIYTYIHVILMKLLNYLQRIPLRTTILVVFALALPK